MPSESVARQARHAETMDGPEGDTMPTNTFRAATRPAAAAWKPRAATPIEWLPGPDGRRHAILVQARHTGQGEIRDLSITCKTQELWGEVQGLVAKHAARNLPAWFASGGSALVRAESAALATLAASLEDLDRELTRR